MAVGRVVLVGGILILLFIPYLLWGTGLQTARSQSLLRHQFAVEQHRAGPVPKRQPAVPAKGVLVVPQLAPVIPEPAVGTAIGVITIPTIGVSMVVVEGTGEAQLQAGPGHYPGTPLPGHLGNAAIAGHRTTYLHPFYDLNALMPGDPITVETLQGIFLYHMTSSEAVLPTDVAVVGPTATPQLTLTTCNPRYSASQRLVIHAVLVASILVHSPSVTGGTKGHPAPPLPAVSAAPGRSWPTAILWGLAVAGLITAIWIGARRTRGGRRAGVLVVGLIAWLAVVFFFFTALAPLLPASF